MKRRITLFVEIDDTAEAGPSSTGVYVLLDGKVQSDGYEHGAWLVNIVPDREASNSTDQLTMRTNLTHELGHVVAAIFNTPANAADPRSQPKGNRDMTNVADRIYAAEAEASDIALQIDPTVDGELLQRNLATYRSPEVTPTFEMAALMEKIVMQLEAAIRQVSPSSPGGSTSGDEGGKS